MLIACNVIEAFSRIPHCVGKEFNLRNSRMSVRSAKLFVIDLKL